MVDLEMTEIQSDRALDMYALTAFLDGAVGGLNGPLRAQLLSGGRSNPTYIVDDGVREWVLRRPPHGLVLASAHDMGREVRVLRALHGTAVPVPAVIADDLAGVVLGVPFYVMERVEGEVIGTVADAARLGPEQRRRLAEAMVDVLAALHTVDVDQVGLSYWDEPGGAVNPVTGGLTALPGFPSRAELVERYAALTGTDVGRLDWYAVLADLKIAVILEQIHARHEQGHTVGGGFADVGAMVDPLLRRAVGRADTARIGR